MKWLLCAAAAATAAVTGTIAADTAAVAAGNNNNNNDLLDRLEQLLDVKLGAQKSHYEQLLAQQQESAEAMLVRQQESYERRLSELQSTVAELTGAEVEAEVFEEEDPAEVRRRQLSSLVDGYSGIDIKREYAGIRLGTESDVALLRNGDGQLLLVADVNVTGSLFVDYMNTTVYDVADFVGAADQRIQTLEDGVQYYKAAVDYGGSWSMSYSTADVPFGATTSVYRIEHPRTAALGYGMFINGEFTAPRDGTYYMLTKIRIKDGSTASLEIDYRLNGVTQEGFEMWITTGDASGRRAAMSSLIVQMKQGDTLAPESDLSIATNIMGQTAVFEIPPDRIAFNAVGSGSSTSNQEPLLSLYTESSRFVTPAEYSDAYDDGVFTAPRAGVYYFTCKERVADSTVGDLEIEWQKNGVDVEGGFEMWLHTGDSSSRRAHMSAILVQLDEGDTIYPHSDIATSAGNKVTMGGFELSPGLPAFKVYGSAFSYATGSVAFGKDATVNTEFNIGGGTMSAGVYTVPEDGFYMFTTKLRTGDSDDGDIEIQWFKNSAIASTNNFEMWLHLGDSTSRRSGMTATVLDCVAGDKVYAASNAALTGTGDIISQWTFSGFKLR